MFYKYGKYVPVYFDKDEIFEFTFVYNIAWGHDLAIQALEQLNDEGDGPSPFGQAFYLTDQEVCKRATLSPSMPMAIHS